MSPGPLSLSPDLKRLRDEGYFVQIRGGLLLLREVPYVDASKDVRTGTLISSLTLAGEVAQNQIPMSSILMAIIRAQPRGSKSSRSNTRAVTLTWGMVSSRDTASRASRRAATTTTITK
jgi:hypothetical protein